MSSFVRHLVFCVSVMLGLIAGGCNRSNKAPKLVIEQRESHKAPARPLPASLRGVAKRIGLLDTEIEHLETHGVVVTRPQDRYGLVPSRIYDEIYQRDLPVLITSDSILYAFHRRYLKYLEWIEYRHLSPMLHQVLLGMRARLIRAVKRGELGPDSLQLAQELDLYLSVPLAILDHDPDPRTLGASPRRLESLLAKVKQAQPAALDLFGVVDPAFDFGQFEPRGHYSKTEEQRQYFRAMAWLGQAPIVLEKVVLGRSTSNPAGIKQAATLSWLLANSGQAKTYRTMVEVLERLVGPADDDTPVSLLDVLERASLSKISDLAAINFTQAKLWLDPSKHLRSRIVNHVHFNDLNTPNLPVDRHFLFLGKRYLLDSHVAQNLVFDRLTHPKDPTKPVLRKLPKGLDILAALGNEHAKKRLKAEFQRFPYEPALDKERDKIAGLDKSTWTQNVHSAWLAAIASLSKSYEDPRLPAPFRSDAWLDKTLQTQLASWAELRHDHILYGKQAISASRGCEFSGAWVEPVPHFFDKMKLLVSLLHANMDAIEALGVGVDKQQHDQLLHFSQVIDTLRTIADKQLNRQALLPQEKHFLKQTVEQETSGYGVTRWDGWYPKLLGVRPDVRFEPTIADVHTDPPDALNNETPQILHVATGSFELATIVVNCGSKDPCIYVGPVSSYYEFVASSRLNYEQWVRALMEHRAKGRPEWTQSFRPR